MPVMNLNRISFLLNSLCFFWLVSIVNVHGQIDLPSIHSTQRITPKTGLKDRKVEQVFRLPSGMYLFVTDKFQFYSGRQFIGEPMIYPLINNIIDDYYLSEDYEIYNLSDFEKLNTEFPSGEIVDVQTEDNTFLFLIRAENTYEIHSWQDQEWSQLLSFSVDFEIEKFSKLNGEFYFLDSNRNLRKHNHTEIKYNGAELPIHDFPAEPHLFHINEKLFFSFSDRKGIFRLNADQSVDTLSLSSVIHHMKKDEAGQALIIGRREVIIKNAIFFVDKKGDYHSWHELLKINDIIADVASSNFLEEITICGLSGIDIVRFSIEKNYVNAYAKIAEDKRGFGNLIMGVGHNKQGGILLVKENRQLYILENDEVHELNLKGDVPVGHYRAPVYDEVKNIFYIPSHNSNREGNIYSVDLNKNQISLIATPKAIFTSFKSADGKIFFAGHESSVYQWHADSLNFYDFNIQLNGREILAFHSGDKHLLGTRQGLFLLDELKNGTNAKMVESLGVKDEIRSIDYHESKYYIGTHGQGFYILDDDLQLIRKIDQDCCSINEYVYSTSVDLESRIWVATNEGLYVMDGEGNLLDHLTTREGISEQEFNTQALTVLPSGEMIFGTVNGITCVNPSIFVPGKPKDFYVEDVLAYVGEEVFVGNEIDGRYKFLTKPDSIKVKLRQYGYNDLQHSFEAMNRMVYEGNADLSLDKNEITILNPNFTSYEMKVNGLNKAALNIDVQRNVPLILRNLFLYLLGLFALGFIVFKIQDNRNKNKLKESEVQRQLAVIKLEALRSQLNPHFIFNSLGAISYFIQTNEMKLANGYLTKFAKLIRAFLESSKNEYISLKGEINLLTYYLTLEKMRFEDAFEYSIEIDPEINLDHEQIPTMLIQPFVENSLIHGINNRQDKEGRIDLIFKKEGDDLLCIIDDNGVGRAKAEQIKLNSIKKHKSRGTQIINERINATHTLDGPSISVNYIDKVEAGMAKGTQVNILIKN